MTLNWLLVLTSVVTGAICWFLSSQSYEIVSHGSHAIGKVVNVHTSPARMHHDPTYFPIIAFDTSDGQHVEAKSVTGSNNKDEFKEGQELKIIYDKQDAKKWSIDRWNDLWLMPVSTALLSLGALIFSVQKKKPKEKRMAVSTSESRPPSS